MVDTIKISQMTPSGTASLGEQIPGLLSGGNVLSTLSWVFLAPGSTAARPAPGPLVNYLLRFNTDNQTYEYYDAETLAWVELSGSGTGTVNPGLINDLAYYAGDGNVLSPISAAANSVLVTSSGSVPSLSTTLPSGLTIPGATITSSTAALTSGQVAATPVNPTDIANKAYVDAAISVTPAAMTEVNDTNVTLTLGGTPATSLLQAVSLTLGWTGTLSGARGGTGVANTGLTITLSGGSTGYVLTSDSSGNATWQANSGGGAITTVDGDSGSVTPSSGTITVSGGTTGLTTSGSSQTLSLTGVLKLANGGTNANLTASNGGIFYSTASAAAILAGTATANQVLLSGSSTTPAWSTATYPATTTINQLLYSSSANVIAGITAADNGVLISGTTGIPSWLANSGTPGYVLTANSGAPPSWQASSASGSVTTIDADSGSATPSAGAITISGGSTGLTTTASSATVDLTGTLAITHGGTGVTSVTVVPAATAFAGWDANKNFTANNLSPALTATVSSGSTISLTVSSTQIQNITGSTAQTVQMPVVTTLPETGFNYTLLNNSSATITVVSSGSNTIGTIAPGDSGTVICTALTGTTAASWFLFVPGFTPNALTEVNDTNVTMSLSGSPNVALLAAVTMTLGWTGQLAVARGGTGVSSVTTSPTATQFAGWDANKNLAANNFIAGYTTTVSSASPIVLTVASSYQQYITGSTAQTVTLPVVSTLANVTTLAQSFLIVNNSSATATINSSGGNLVESLPAGSQAVFTAISNSGTTAASWSSDFVLNIAGVSSITGTANQVIASASTGAVTLSLPQSIATTSAVQFNSVRFNTTNGILDSNGNVMLALSASSSSVNYFTFFNAATTIAPALEVVGSDTNIEFDLYAKGTSPIGIFGASGSTTPFKISNGTGYQHQTNFVFANTNAVRNVTFPDASFTISTAVISTQIFTSGSGTYTPTAGAQYVWVRAVAGGGQGGGATAGTSQVGTGGGGGAGGYGEFWEAATSRAYSVGAGGSTGTTSTGQSGGNTTFGTAGAQLSLVGGTGGSSQNSQVTSALAAGGAGGAATTATFGIAGTKGRSGYASTAFGTLAGDGGVSPFGGNGVAAVQNSTGGVAGSAATGYGSGGGGSGAQGSNSANGGAGGSGVIIITEYA